MSIKKNPKNPNTEIKKVDQKTFKRIADKFREYWKYLFGLVIIYIVCYLIWASSSTLVRETAEAENWNGNSLILVITLALGQGLLFSLDGLVTSLLKSPFNQMCYAINKAEGIPDKKKDYIITKATESNEHCKETLKKFGIITIVGELAKTFIKIKKDGDETIYEKYMVISYLVPLFFAVLAIWQINRELKKIKKLSSTFHEKQQRVS